MEFLAFTFDAIGKIMIAYTAVMVHHRFWKEHKIDVHVFQAMRREQKIAILGIFFIALGYLLHIYRLFIE